MRPLEVIATIACDDVREETNGKRTFVGVLNPTIGLASYPAQIRLWFVLIANIREVGTDVVVMRVVDATGQELGDGEGRIVFQKTGGVIAIPTGPWQLALERPTTFHLELQDGGKWKRLQSWDAGDEQEAPAPRRRRQPASKRRTSKSKAA